MAEAESRLQTQINPALRRSYDLRGRYGEQLGVKDAEALGLVFASMAAARGLHHIAVCRDGRLSSPALEAALVRGLVRGGAAVHRLPLGPTPMLQFALAANGLDGGIMVTGSHNPPDQNGFKLLLGGGPVWGEDLGALWTVEGKAQAGGRVMELDPTADYVAALLAPLSEMRPLNVAWDCGNGATGAVVEQLVQHLPGRHLVLHAEIDGRFPNHHPDPAVAANMRDLQQAVVTNGLDLGVAFDGDGDRLGAVDGTGAIVWPDQLLLLAEDLLIERPGSTILGDVKSSDLLFDGIRAAGGQAVMAPSGYVKLRARMVELGAPLAGEMSGHIFFADRWHGGDDGICGAVRLMVALARRGSDLAVFRRTLPARAATPELRIPCPDERKAEVIAEVAARVAAEGHMVDRTDGLRLHGPDGWWLLRASGTEAKLTLRCEAQDQDALARLRSALAGHLRAAGVEPGPL